MNPKYSNKSLSKYKPVLKSQCQARESVYNVTTVLYAWTDWCDDCSLLEELNATIKGGIKFVALVYPLCDDWERYEYLYKIERLFNIWQCHQDWSAVEGAKRPDKHMWCHFFMSYDRSTLNNSMARWKPFALGMYALLEDILNTYTHEQKFRLSHALGQYYSGKLDEWKAMETGVRFASIDAVLVLKRQSFPAMTFLLLIEYAYKICLSDSEWESPALHEFLTAATDCMIFAQDLWSFDSEYSEQGYARENLAKLVNVVAVAAGAEQCSIEVAMDKMTNRLAALEARMRTLMENIKKGQGVSEALLTFVNGVMLAVGGYQKALMFIDRYNHKSY